MPSLDFKAFKTAVYQNWAERFSCSLETLHTPGTEVLPEEEFTNAIHTWIIGEHAFVRLDPKLEGLARAALDSLSSPVPLRAEHISPVLGSHQIREIEDNILSYLFPPELPAVSMPRPFTFRQLTSQDADALAEMQAACQPDEVDEGEVSVEDEIGFGCFDGPRLAAVATGFRLTGFMDIGVLTHPDYRRRGLGKTTVAILSRWCTEHDVIAQYRCRVDNVGSHNIAQALNFNLVFDQQSVYFVAEDD